MRTDLVEIEKRRVWHPFTQMRDWCAPEHEPLFLEEGRGEMLRSSDGRWFIDGNSSIWTNIHGHNHPRINEAIRAQLERVAHTSFLGFTHEAAARLAERLCRLWPGGRLTRVFYSDDGSTAIECAIKMTAQYWQQTPGGEGRTVFAAFDQAYHGDTAGASSLGGIGRFHDRFGMIHFPVRRLAAVEELEALPESEASRLAAVVIEPLVQGAAGIRLWPSGMLARLRAWCDRTGALLIADEVMTGFGRTGTMFACEQEGVTPDFVALAKGLTGGYLPLAATLTTERVFEAFLGSFEEGRTFYYGHSYSGSQLGCAAALASLGVFDEEKTLERLGPKIALLRELLTAACGKSPWLGGFRQCGFIAGIDIVRDKGSGGRFPAALQAGARVCVAARERGLLTRPIGDTVILMPPLCISEERLAQAVEAVVYGAEAAAGRLAD